MAASPLNLCSMLRNLQRHMKKEPSITHRFFNSPVFRFVLVLEFRLDWFFFLFLIDLVLFNVVEGFVVNVEIGVV